MNRALNIVVALAVVLAAGMVGCQRRGTGTVVIPDPGPAQYAEAMRLAEEAEKAREAGKTDLAIELFNKSLQQSREIALVWHNLGMLMLDKGDRMVAVEYLNNAAELAMENPRPYYNIALIYADNAQPDKALGYFRKALERDKKDLLSLRGVAKTCKRLMLADEEALEWMKTGLMMERDAEWRLIFEEEKLRIDGALQAAGRTGKF